ncbi:hypothetical protein MYSTI_05386 [Myxococcus stipitatus DSM 14675]|uniref:Uncharacterized protein n=1 Tax=Myxococcus stipitatus (strain DSM 14675 / JCM 12634 / Mx s8) TaxID=1278073 RepID=L7UFL5_MYXSD|nr:hypothetical protein [Myxococcus stipitatus]AGC46665.1 hypothetical protein MYSTI_05386 [Myxococcus stipitatus DSM 14675]
MAGEARQAERRDVHQSVISALYHLLKGASAAERFIQEAEAAGDPELAQFFRDWSEEQRHLAERAKNLLGTRMAALRTPVSARRRADKAPAKAAAERSFANMGVKSGGNPSDDGVDERSKESFPASDAPATY